MFCALLGIDIRLTFTGPLVLWFHKSLDFFNNILFVSFYVEGNENLLT